MSGVEEVVGGQDGLVRVPEDQDRSAAEVLDGKAICLGSEDSRECNQIKLSSDKKKMRKFEIRMRINNNIKEK